MDVSNNLTTGLLSAASYLKDNRLLPTGFNVVDAPDDISPKGLASADENFIGGMDDVSYIIDVSHSDGPYHVVVELLYQPIAYRWAEDVMNSNSERALLFWDYYNSSSNTSLLIAQQELDIH